MLVPRGVTTLFSSQSGCRCEQTETLTVLRISEALATSLKPMPVLFTMSWCWPVYWNIGISRIIFLYNIMHEVHETLEKGVLLSEVSSDATRTSFDSKEAFVSIRLWGNTKIDECRRKNSLWKVPLGLGLGFKWMQTTWKEIKTCPWCPNLKKTHIEKKCSIQNHNFYVIKTQL
jgi:hypothetical protein